MSAELFCQQKPVFLRNKVVYFKIFPSFWGIVESSQKTKIQEKNMCNSSFSVLVNGGQTVICGTPEFLPIPGMCLIVFDHAFI